MSKRARRLAAGLFPLQVELLENRMLLSAAATTTAMAASSDPILLGQIIALSATVASAGGSPAGTVTFEDGSTLIGTAAIDPTTHTAVGFTNSLTLGTHNLTAIYNATSSFSGSTSAAVVETVDPTSDVNPADDATTTTTLVASSNPIELGQVVALTATVTGASGFPTGTVSFFDGSALIGTVNINTKNQQAIGFTNTLTAGTHNITAVFDGATGFATSTSSAVSLVVNNDVITTTAMVASSNPIAQGQVLGLVATVTAASGTPAGTVTFNDGSTLIGAVTVDPTTHEAIAFTSSLTGGTHNITATYNSGGNGFVASSSSLSIVVKSDVSSTTILVASSNPVVEGQVIALTATVTAASGDPTGNVTFMDGSTLIGAVAIDPATQQAVAFTSSLTIGGHTITADYTGDTGYMSSKSSGISETVNPVGADTTTGLAVSPNPELAGQTIALTATVTSLAGIPTGTVTFMDGSTLIGTVAINPATQQAIGFTDALTAGSHAITAMYSGATTFASSTSTTVNEQVSPVGTLTTTALTSSSHTVVSGETVALVATVTATSGSPAGSVSFMDGTTLLGTVAINTGTHQAIAYSNLLSVGMHNITAVYAGSSTFATSTSATVHEVVNIDATATTVTAPNNVNAGSLVVLTATVTPFAPGAGIPTGTVTFMDGSTLIGTTSIDPLTHTYLAGTVSLTPGVHTITAAYGGSSGYTASTSVGLSETIVGISTTTTLTASTAATTVGQTVTFTSTVTAGSGGIPTGTVTFTDGSTTVGTAPLDATGKATLSEYNLFVGTNAVTATYSGDNVHAVSSSNGSTMLAITMPTLTTTSDQLQYAIATQGTGPTAEQNQLVQVDYTGYLDNGTKFDSSLLPGRTPFDFALSDTEGGAIQGFVEAVVGAKVGETVVAVIPPALGYGNVANGPIPAGSTLNFIVRLIAVNLPRLTITPAVDTSSPLTPGEAASAAVGTDFGSEIVGLSTAASSFTLGSADIAPNFTLTSTSTPIIQIIGADPNDFVITQPPYIETTSNGTTTGGVFTIAFVPTATGVRTATIRISTNDSDFPTFTFNVTGVGT
jgi:hypothetical protein